MNAPEVVNVTVRPVDEFSLTHPDLVALGVIARKQAQRLAKAFPRELRRAYWRGFVEGCTGRCLDVGDFSPDEHVAYVCGGMDGSEWAQ